jgi:hypothetical protein
MSVASLVPAAYAVRAKATRKQMHQDSDVLLKSRNNKAYEVDLPTAMGWFAGDKTVLIWRRVKSELNSKKSNKPNIIENFKELWENMIKQLEKLWGSSSPNNNRKSSEPLEEITKAKTTLEEITKAKTTLEDLHKKWMKNLKETIDIVKKNVPSSQELKKQEDYIPWTKQKNKLLSRFWADPSVLNKIFSSWAEKLQNNNDVKMQMQYVLVMLYMIRDMIFRIFFTTCQELQIAVKELNPEDVAHTVEVLKVPNTIEYQNKHERHSSSSHNEDSADDKWNQVLLWLNNICTHVRKFTASGSTTVAGKDWPDIHKDWCLLYKYLLEYSYFFYNPKNSLYWGDHDPDQTPPQPYDRMEWISCDLTKRASIVPTKAKLQLLLPAISTRFNHDQYCPSVSTAYLVAHEK